MRFETWDEGGETWDLGHEIREVGQVMLCMR